MESVRTGKTSMAVKCTDTENESDQITGARAFWNSKRALRWVPKCVPNAAGQMFATPYSELLLRGIIFLIGHYSGT